LSDLSQTVDTGVGEDPPRWKGRALPIEGLFLWVGITATLAHRGWPAWATPLLPSLWINLPLISLLARREPLTDWGLAIPDLASTGRHVAVFTLLLAPASLLGLHLIGAIDLAWPDNPGAIAASLGRQLVWVALPEEVFFRGYLWRRLGSEVDVPSGRLRRIVVNATLFAATHYWIQPGMWAVATWVPGLYFTWLRCRTKGVLAPILCHAIANTMLFAGTGALR
jgi:membrane protease YdiL (CAAX protease family)